MIFLIMGNKIKGQGKQWTNREYSVQNNEDVDHQDVIMYCTTNQFTEL